MTTYDWGDDFPVLSGSRLDLRGMTPADAPAVLRIFGDPEVMEYWSHGPLVDEAAAAEYVASTRSLFERRELFQWGAALRETGEVVGTTTLLAVDETHGRAEVGIALAQAHWGRGLASEILDVILSFAFDVLNLHRIEADIDPDNARSLALFERFGFEREGLLRERWFHMGERRDTVLLGLLKPEREVRT